MFIKNHLAVLSIAIVLCVLYVTVNCDGGHSSTYRKQDDHGHYSFGYHIKDKKGATNFRKEKGDGWNKVSGSYGLHDKDGRLRIVHYKADKKGFRAVIKTNEPGTASEDSAHAIYNGVDDSHWAQKSHVESGSHGGWHHEKKHEDHWGHKEDHWGHEKKKEHHGWEGEKKHENHW